jgi:hypothetical protein
LGDEIKQDEWAGHVEHMGEEVDCIQDFGEKPEGKRPLARPRHRWEDINKTDLKETA